MKKQTQIPQFATEEEIQRRADEGTLDDILPELEAEMRGNQWLAKGNDAAELGHKEKAERCYAKGQYWLDRFNRLTGRS